MAVLQGETVYRVDNKPFDTQNIAHLFKVENTYILNIKDKDFKGFVFYKVDDVNYSRGNLYLAFLNVSSSPLHFGAICWMTP